MDATQFATQLSILRKPFSANQISKLPKESRAQADERKANRNAAINCPVCGGWHHKNAVHLDYVGHAALTDRLLDVDPTWSWEPVAFGADGLPLMDRNGGMWIRLTVCGITRMGYGNAEGKSGGDAIKEIIGDALRNAAMRFGAALDLWHKGDLHADDEGPIDGGKPEQTQSATKSQPRKQKSADQPQAWTPPPALEGDADACKSKSDWNALYNRFAPYAAGLDDAAKKAAWTWLVGKAKAAGYRWDKDGVLFEPIVAPAQTLDFLSA